MGVQVKKRYFYQVLMKPEIYLQIFENNTQISNFKKILQWVPISPMRTDRLLDLTKLIVVSPILRTRLKT